MWPRTIMWPIQTRFGVRERIEYLTRQAQERIAEKRVALEEQLWAVLEADIGAFWETYEAAKTGRDGKLATDQEGKMLAVRKQRAKPINDLPLEFRKLIEDVTIDGNGNVIQSFIQRPKRIGTCARCSISAAAKRKKLMTFPSFPMPS
jgi:hypothetical protein